MLFSSVRAVIESSTTSNFAEEPRVAGAGWRLSSTADFIRSATFRMGTTFPVAKHGRPPCSPHADELRSKAFLLANHFIHREAICLSDAARTTIDRLSGPCREPSVGSCKAS